MPTPKEGESKNEFMGRCVPMRHGEHPSEPNEQSVAVCFSIWRKAHPKDKSTKKPMEKKK